MKGNITVLGQPILLGNNLCQEIILSPSTQTCALGTTPIPKSKYQFSRNWHKADFYYADFEIITDWCIQQFGAHPIRHDAWSRWWHNGQDRVFFRDEKDYHWYILRWGQ